MRYEGAEVGEEVGLGTDGGIEEGSRGEDAVKRGRGGGVELHAVAE